MTPLTGRDVACFAVPLCPDAEDFSGHTVLDEFLTRGLIENLDVSVPDSTSQHVPGVRIPNDRPMVELVDTVRARKFGELDADGLMLMLLRVTTDALDPGIVLAHFLRPHLHHSVRDTVGPTQGLEIG